MSRFGFARWAVRYRLDEKAETLLMAAALTAAALSLAVSDFQTGILLAWFACAGIAFLLLRRRRVEDSSAARTRAALERRLGAIGAASDGIAVFEADGSLSYANPSVRAMLGGGADEVASLALLLGEQLAGALDTLSSGRVWGGVLSRQDAGAPREVEVALSPAEGGVVVCVLRDTTSRLKFEAESRALHERAMRTERTEALGRLSSGIAHEFNNILAGVLGYANFLAEDLPADSPSRHHVDQIIVAGERAKALVQQIQAFARVEDADYEPFDLAELVRETCSFLDATLPGKVDLKARSLCPSAPVIGSRTQISRALISLGLAAAERLGEEGGEVEVVLLDVSPAEAGKPHYRIRVSDSGPTPAPEALARAFEPYAELCGGVLGTGIAAAYGIVVSHGGAAAAGLSDSGGLRIDLDLPCEAGKAEVTPTGQPAPAETGLRILVVDDESSVSAMLCEALDRMGHQATMATSAVGVLGMVIADRDAFDVVVSDVLMPALNGMELARQIHALGGPPVILCTGNAGGAEGCRLPDGVIRMLRKPLGVGDLAAALDLVRRDSADGRSYCAAIAV